jgi:hypothetical protein
MRARFRPGKAPRTDPSAMRRVPKLGDFWIFNLILGQYDGHETKRKMPRRGVSSVGNCVSNLQQSAPIVRRGVVRHRFGTHRDPRAFRNT